MKLKAVKLSGKHRPEHSKAQEAEAQKCEKSIGTI